MLLVWGAVMSSYLQLSNRGPRWTSLKFQEQFDSLSQTSKQTHCHKYGDVRHSRVADSKTEEKKNIYITGYMCDHQSRELSVHCNQICKGHLQASIALSCVSDQEKVVAVTPQTIFLRLRSARISNRCGSANKKPPWDCARRLRMQQRG